MFPCVQHCAKATWCLLVSWFTRSSKFLPLLRAATSLPVSVLTPGRTNCRSSMVISDQQCSSFVPNTRPQFRCELCPLSLLKHRASPAFPFWDFLHVLGTCSLSQVLHGNRFSYLYHTSRVSEPQELEFQMVVSHSMSAGNGTEVPWKRIQCS